MKYTIRLLGIFLLLLILPFVSCKKLYAVTFFEDDFSDGTLNKWVQDVGNVGNTSSWFASDGTLHSKVTKGQFSFLYANTTSIPKNFIFSSDVKNISGIDQQFIFRASDDRRENYMVDYRYNDSRWWWDNNNIKVSRTYYDHQKILSVYPSSDSIPRFHITQGIDHNIRIIFNHNNIKVYFDNNLAADVVDTDVPLNSTGFGLMTWGGDFNYSSENTYKNIRIYSSESVSRNKIIILPGMGASWNAEAILFGSTAPSYQWTMTPFVSNYNLLINALKDNGLVENQDFYVWNYDWRKPLNQIVTDFDNYINGLNIGSNEKIDLVGHSLGGLVARIWTQDHPALVNETITLGSPHYGAVKAYEAWNGAKISDNLDIASIGLNVFLQIQKKNNDTSVQTLRKYAPIVFDLSPTFSFLKRNASILIGNSSQYLVSKNNTVSTITDRLSTINGKGVATREWINLGERSLVDKVLGIWEDGRPVSYTNGEGDGLILKKSALIPGSLNSEFNSNHNALVDNSTNWILQKLGLGVTVGIISDYPVKQAVFYLGSPANMTVNCGGIEKSDIDGWIVVDNQEAKNCQVNLIGKNGGGTYHLVAGGNNDWQYLEGEIADNQSLNIAVNGVNAHWQMLKRDFEDLGLSAGVAMVEQKNIISATDEYIKFRSNAKNYKYSEEILENLRYVLNSSNVSSTEINNVYQKAMVSKSLVDTNLRLMARNGTLPKYSAAMNYEQANNLMNLGKNYAANYLANKLYGILWK